MKKFIITSLLVVLVSTLVQSQQTWIKIDTVRAKVQVTEAEVIVSPEPCEKLGDDFWDLILGDQIFADVEELRAILEPFDFKSTSCYLDPESSSVVFHFEKVIIESETRYGRKDDN